MRKFQMTRLAAVPISLALVLASCGSDNASSEAPTDSDATPSEATQPEATPSDATQPEAGDSATTDPAADPTEAGEPVVIGMISDLTGPTSDVGTPYSEGQRAYVDFVNESGGMDGREIDLLWGDYKYDVAIAEQLYSQYVSEGAVAFMGWGTGDTEALRERIIVDEVPFMSASLAETLIDPTETPYNFVPVSTYSEQMRVALKYVADEGGGSVAVFHNDSPFGTSPLADGEAYIADNDLDIDFKSYPMPGGATDYTGEIVQASNPDYVVIQNVSSPAATLVRDLATSGSDATVICLNWCGTEVMIELAGADAEGVLSAQPFFGPASEAEGLDEIVEFAGDIDKVSIGYIHGWTAMKVMVTAITAVVESGDEVTGPAIAEALQSTSIETGGLSADIAFSADSHAGMVGAPMQIVTDGVWQPFQEVTVP